MKRVLRSAVFAFIATMMFAQSPPGPRVAALGTISGTVVRSSGHPIPQAKVTLTTWRTGFTRNTVTDAEGRFTFGKIPPGEYGLTAEHPGLIGFVRDASATVDVKAGADIRDVVFKVASPATVEGHITDDQGIPLTDISVYVRRLDGYMNSGKSNSAGNYRVPGLPPGNYQIAAADLRFPENARLGTRYYPDVPHASSAAIAHLKERDVLPANFVFRRGPTLCVSGKISGFDPAKEEYWLDVSVDNEFAADSSFEGSSNLVEADGSFAIPLPSGPYTLTGVARRKGTRAARRAVRKIVVTDQDIGGLTLDIPPRHLVAISAKVLVEGQSAAPAFCGGGLTDAIRESSFVSGNMDFFPQLWGAVAEDGSLNLEAERGELYRAEVNCTDRYYIKRVAANGIDVTGVLFRVTEPLTMTFLLAKDFARVSGRVVDRNHRPVRNAAILAVPEEPFRGWFPGYGRGFSRVDGSFLISNLRPGKYKLLAFDASPLRLVGETVISPAHESLAKPIAAAPGSSQRIELTLISNDKSGR